MKAVLMSIQPKWCELIANGKKTVEVRKTNPKLETPFKVYIYCTQGDKSQALLGGNPMRIVICTNYKSTIPVGCYIANGKVIGEFVCDNIAKGNSQLGYCLSMQEISEYANGKEVYGWHISNLVIYDEPRALSEFHKPTMPTGLRYENDVITRPPQSWCYVESKE